MNKYVYFAKKIKLGKFIYIMSLMILSFFMVSEANCQEEPWKFIKERDGIKIYTRNQESNPVKSFKGEAEFKTTMAKVSQIIGRIESFEWWDDDISEIKVLKYEEEKLIRYYLVYDVPWPLSDRDLCVETIITNDTAAGTRVVYATPLTGVIPEYPDKVRIKSYWQRWTMNDTGNGTVHLVLEGSVDPGGNIPAWMVNMVITDTPMNIMTTVREKVQGK
jgi:hypothetical protein